jgi:hypothetical protein
LKEDKDASLFPPRATGGRDSLFPPRLQGAKKEKAKKEKVAKEGKVKKKKVHVTPITVYNTHIISILHVLYSYTYM